jgi:hypothetical protein
MKALSVKQPWAWLLANGYKDIENRTWNTTLRGEFLIHASKQFDMRGFDFVIGRDLDIWLPQKYDLGGIVGIAEITGVVMVSDSKWFDGPYGYEIKNACPLPFKPLLGQLNFFKVKEDFYGTAEIEASRKNFRQDSSRTHHRPV